VFSLAELKELAHTPPSKTPIAAQTMESRCPEGQRRSYLNVSFELELYGSADE